VLIYERHQSVLITTKKQWPEPCKYSLGEWRPLTELNCLTSQTDGMMKRFVDKTWSHLYLRLRGTTVKYKRHVHYRRSRNSSSNDSFINIAVMRIYVQRNLVLTQYHNQTDKEARCVYTTIPSLINSTALLYQRAKYDT